MTPHKTGDSTSIVRGVRPSTPSLKGQAGAKVARLPKSTTPIGGYGTTSLSHHKSEVAQQYEPSGTDPVRQHHKMAIEGLGHSDTSIAPVLGK